ncbi:MAG: NAD(P)/FAD-dependent oxidoreductase [Dehalococcoidia bacterium]
MVDVDLAIIGGGVAGLTAGLYAAWHRLDAVLVERMGTGGQIVNADAIHNYPGFPRGIKGYELGPQIAEQAIDLGLRIEYADVQSLGSEGGAHVLNTDGEGFRARAVIVAAGSSIARLGCPGEEQFEGRGVSYCAVCDADFFRDQPVVVVGGGDSAIDEALYLATVVSSITLVVRGDRLRAAPAIAEQALSHPKIHVRWQTELAAIEGGDTVERVRAIRDGTSEESIECGGIFIYVGLQPNTSPFRDVLPLDAAGHIPVDPWMRSSVPGVFAAGDIRQHSARQLVTSAGDGATAAIAAARYLKDGVWPAPAQIA